MRCKGDGICTKCDGAKIYRVNDKKCFKCSGSQICKICDGTGVSCKKCVKGLVACDNDYKCSKCNGSGKGTHPCESNQTNNKEDFKNHYDDENFIDDLFDNECMTCFGDKTIRCTKCSFGDCISCGGDGYFPYFDSNDNLKKRDCSSCLSGNCTKCFGTGFVDCPSCY